MYSVEELAGNLYTKAGKEGISCLFYIQTARKPHRLLTVFRRKKNQELGSAYFKTLLLSKTMVQEEEEDGRKRKGSGEKGKEEK